MISKNPGNHEPFLSNHTHCENWKKIRNRMILQSFQSIEPYNIEKENHIENHCMHQAIARLGSESQG